MPGEGRRGLRSRVTTVGPIRAAGSDNKPAATCTASGSQAMQNHQISADRM